MLLGITRKLLPELSVLAFFAYGERCFSCDPAQLFGHNTN